MRLGLFLVATLLLAGCMQGSPGPSEDVGASEEAAPETQLSFGTPITVIPSCGQALSRCFEPSVAATTVGILVVNSYTAPFARSTDGERFMLVPGPGGASLVGSGGDALVQTDEAGNVWWSVLGTSSLRVARSPDAGLTWDLDTKVSLPSTPDRQWLTFGPARILITYQGDAGVHAASSSDGGRTWGEPVAIDEAAHIHGPGAWCQDRFVVPLFDEGRLNLALSPDTEAWTLNPVPNATGGFFPAVTCTPRGVLVAWRAGDGSLQTAESTDLGGSWLPQVQRSLSGERLSVSPTLVQDGEATWVAYFSASDDGVPADLFVVRIEEGQVSRGLAVSQLQTAREDRPGNADFPWMVVRDGKPLVAYADGTTVKLVSGV